MGLLTAIRDYFTLPQVEQRALSPTQAWARDLNWGGPSPSGERVDQSNATALSTVYACVSLIADIVSTLPVDVYIKWDGFPKPYRPRPTWLDEPIPNDPSVTRSQHFSQVVLSLMFDGNAFILAQPSVLDPQVLTVLDPVKVRIRDTGNGQPPEYYVGPQYSPTLLRRDQIVHIPRTRRPGESRGMSPIDEAAETLGIALAAQRHSGRFYRNGTLMSTIINVPGEMSEEDALALRDAFSQRHSGDNVFRTGVLTGGATATSLGVTPEQAQFLDTIKFHVLEVCRLYRVPPMLVGVNDPGAVSYASATEAVRAFHVNTLAPLLQIISQGYKRLMPDDRVYLQFDANGLLRADPEQRFNSYEAGLRSGWLSRNEVRGWEELPPIKGDGGDIYTVQAQMVTVDSVANPPEPPPAPEGGAPAPPFERHLSGQHDQKKHGQKGYLAVDSPAVMGAAADAHAAAVAAEPGITAGMGSIATASGGELVGLDFRVKSEASIARKLATDPDYVHERLPLADRSARLKDTVRYTVQLDEGHYSDGIRRGLDEARSQGYSVEAKNVWAANKDGYAGYHATLRKEGQPAVELQFHTKRSFTAKEIGNPPDVPPSHKLYETLRTSRSPSVRARIQAQIDSVWGPIRATAPAGIMLLP